MIVYHRALSHPRYTAKPHAEGGWLICEDGQAIAYTASEAYARAMAQALNVQRALLAAQVSVGRPPREPGLN